MKTEPRARRCGSEEETRQLAARLAPELAGGALVSLEGDLGAGKTVFTGGLAEACGLSPEEVSSPSYVLAVEHASAEPPLLHVDLYRLPDGAGIDDLGIEEALDRGWLVVVEWGERLPDLLRAPAWRVILREDPDDPSARLVTILRP